MLKNIWALGLIITLLSGCDYHHTRNDNKDTQQGQFGEKPKAITFEMVSEKVLKPRCVECHSDSTVNKGGVNLETYANVFENREDILEQITEKEMPPKRRGPLTDSEYALITAWLNQGALENGASAEVIAAEPTTVEQGFTIDIPEDQIITLPEPVLQIDEQAIIEKVIASAPTEVASSTFVITEDNIAVLYADKDRIAIAYESHTEPLMLKMKMDLGENLCQAEYIKPNCTYHLDIAFDKIVLRWIKHSDPAMIGKAVKTRQRYDGAGQIPFNDFNTQSVYSYVDRFLGLKNEERFKPDAISCDQYDWLDTNIKNQKNVKFLSWAAENMNINTETGVNENMTTAVYENTKWQLSQNNLLLAGVDRVQANNGFGRFTAILPLGQVSTVNYVNSKSETCQFSFSHSIQSAVEGIDFDHNFNTNPRFRIYDRPKSMAFKQIKAQLSNAAQMEYE